MGTAYPPSPNGEIWSSDMHFLGVFLSVTEEVGFGGSQTLKLRPTINI